MTRLEAFSGHVFEALGISRSLARVGKSTLKPLMKYSYILISFRLFILDQ